MSFLPKNVVPPNFVEEETFGFEPLTINHLDIDYEAVMASREQLNRWSQSTWPTPKFTKMENRIDLERHEREHLEGQGFTFTILNSTKEMCLGCVYIVPLFAEMKGKYPQIAAKKTAQVRYWVRTSHLKTDVEMLITQRLINWIRDDWWFDGVFFCTNPKCPEQIELFENKMRLQKHLEMEITQERPGFWLFYS
jgi:hypothetical protein